MKYLVINKGPRGSYADIPLSALQATKEWFKALRTNGTADCIYSFVTKGGMAVLNANSHEEVMKILRAGPGWGFNEIEVHVLCDVGQSMDALIETRQKASK